MFLKQILKVIPFTSFLTQDTTIKKCVISKIGKNIAVNVKELSIYKNIKKMEYNIYEKKIFFLYTD